MTTTYQKLDPKTIHYRDYRVASFSIEVSLAKVDVLLKQIESILENHVPEVSWAQEIGESHWKVVLLFDWGLFVNS